MLSGGQQQRTAITRLFLKKPAHHSSTSPPSASKPSSRVWMASLPMSVVWMRRGMAPLRIKRARSQKSAAASGPGRQMVFCNRKRVWKMLLRRAWQRFQMKGKPSRSTARVLSKPGAWGMGRMSRWQEYGLSYASHGPGILRFILAKWPPRAPFCASATITSPERLR